MFTPQVLANSKPQLGEVGERGFPFLIATPKMKYRPSKDLGKKLMYMGVLSKTHNSYSLSNI